ncbi:MAG: hypothetical protein ACK2VA_09365 [Anaerolineae bacterium]
MSERQRRRMSYLLRLWQAEHKGALVWRASLEDAHTGERRGFANLADLYASLEQETAAASKESPPNPRRKEVVT